MKVEKITAYKSDDECVYEHEADAINQNIELCIDRMNHQCESSDSSIYRDVKRWFFNHPKEVKYIQANIRKIEDLI